MIPAKDREQIDQVVELIDDLFLLLGLRIAQNLHPTGVPASVVAHAKKQIADRIESLGAELK